MNKLKLIRAKILFGSIQHKGSLGKITDFDINSFNFCIEGYPRSANTTVNYLLLPLLEKKFGDIDTIIHHTHSFKTMKFCLLMDIPQLILIRNPADAIASNYIYHEGRASLSLLTKKWINYYKLVKKNRAKVLLCSFSSATNDINNVISNINKIYGFDLSLIENLDEKINSMKNTYREHTEEKRGEEYYTIYPLPDNNRALLKGEVLDKIPASSLNEANKIYQSLLVHSI